MASSDLRVPMAPALQAFGVDATVTRPAPDDTPIETTVIWLPPFTEDVPFSGEFQRREPRLVLAIDRAAVPTVPMRTVIEAPEMAGGEVKTWRVDGFERGDPEHHRVTVVQVSDES